MSFRAYLSGNPVHDRVITAFAQGCGAELVKDWKYEPSEVAIIFGVYKSRVPVSIPRGEIFRQQRSNKSDVLVLETGYINRGDGETHHYAAGFNGLNGRADFKNHGMPDDRVKKLGVEMAPWRTEGEHLLLCSQVPWDASVDHVHHEMWVYDTAKLMQHYSKRPVRFRPHPLANIPTPKGCKPCRTYLQDDLKNCWAVVTFNSNSAVESAIEGIPVFAFDEGSMAKEIANNWLQDLDKPRTPDREQWLADLCYAQWTLEEMRSGEAWLHLSR
jgi:hypothetical protein